MTETLNLYYLNSDFDLGLRPRPRQLENPNLVRQVRELSVQSILGAEESDAAWVRADVPVEYTDYLTQSGVPVPRLLAHPQIDPTLNLRPFGFSHEAIELNKLHSQPTAHPALSVIRRVNSRSFALELESELFPDNAHGKLIESLAELKRFMAATPPGSEWVIKAEHGHAGLANRRLRNRQLSSADVRFVNSRLAEDDRMIIEPWRQRVCDRCFVFDVPFSATSLRIHETACTDGGALVGAIFDPETQADVPRRALRAAAVQIAGRLDDAGYFGPVCVDAFDWRDEDRVRLRPFVDLNARRSMSDGAYRLWQRIAPTQTLFYRFFNRRKLTALPTDLHLIVEALGSNRYDPQRQHGILIASPPRIKIDGETRSPGKLAIIFIASGRAEVTALERWFRDKFEV